MPRPTLCPFERDDAPREIVAYATLAPAPRDLRAVLSHRDCRCDRCTAVRRAHAETLLLARRLASGATPAQAHVQRIDAFLSTVRESSRTGRVGGKES